MNKKTIKKVVGGSLAVLGVASVAAGIAAKHKKIGAMAENSSVKRTYTDDAAIDELIGHIGFGEPVCVDRALHKKVLITGAGSYIGESFKEYAKVNYPDNFEIETLDMLDENWCEHDFSSYDIVYHVAGLAHADVGNVTDDVKEKYYAVNTDLALKVAEKAKSEGVKEFVFMSSMIVYGDSAPYGKNKVIDKHTVPAPSNFYGDSKLQADVAVRRLADNDFKVIVIRPPMIYGKKSKGNYQMLAKIAKKLPVFPDVDNQRSMLYVGNLCEFLCQIMLVRELKENAVVLIPQNAEWTRTSDMVKSIADVSCHKIFVTKLLNIGVCLGSKFGGKIGGLVNKAFGNSCYQNGLSVYQGIDYQMADLKKSIRLSEGQAIENTTNRALILASVASMIDQFNMPNIKLLQELGYSVDVIADFVDGGSITAERTADLERRLSEMNVTFYRVPIPRDITQIGRIMYAYKQIKSIMKDRKYSLVHCHSPIGGVLCRLAARESRRLGTKVIYTAHGFHFYKGAPKKNWVLFYPVEKFCSRYTDVLITINKEDYQFAVDHMDAKQIKYIPGVGIDTDTFARSSEIRKTKRTELGMGDDDVVLLSVGELNDNKNHEVIVRAIAGLDDNRNVHYFIAGKGDKGEYLEELAAKLNVKLYLLGYRTDIPELYSAADMFVFPSFREGLSVSLMEAMASKLPCVVSKIRGNVDLIDENEGGHLCRPDSVNEFSHAIDDLINNEDERFEYGRHNKDKVSKFDKKNVMISMKKLYSE